MGCKYSPSNCHEEINSNWISILAMAIFWWTNKISFGRLNSNIYSYFSQTTRNFVCGPMLTYCIYVPSFVYNKNRLLTQINTN